MVHTFEQKKTIDFVETFALVIKLMTIRTIISLVAFKGWKMHHIDMIFKKTLCIYLAQWQNLNTSRNLVVCNQSLCRCVQLGVICNYIGCVCN
jgi:hypothetical protein